MNLIIPEITIRISIRETQKAYQIYPRYIQHEFGKEMKAISYFCSFVLGKSSD